MKGGKIGSTHFDYAEALNKSGYTNVPFWMVPGIRRHAKNLERLRKAINRERKRHGLPPTGIKINSWIRSPRHNREVGGARFSKHLRGIATDISRQEVHRLCPWKGGAVEFDATCNRIFKKGGFGQYPGGARHVDSRGYRARWTSWRPGKR